MDPVIVILLATAGALVGAYINYYLALWVGRPLVYSFADSKLGHAAGISRMNIGVFTIFTSLGALIWNIILGLLGWWLAETVPYDDLLPQIEKYNSYLTYAGLALGFICLVVIIRNVMKANK